MELHHYTTPARARTIATSGLEPRSTLPGTIIPVTFAYLNQAHIAWTAARHDENRGLAALFLLRMDAKAEGTEGLVHLTFEAPAETAVYDNAVLEHGVEAYLMSRRVSGDGTAFMEKPEAAVAETIPPHALTARFVSEAALEELFDEYGFFQRPVPRTQQPFKTQRA